MNKTIGNFLGGDLIRAIDLGADGGVPVNWESFQDLMVVEAFEPNEIECAKQDAASKPGIRWHPVAIASKSELKRFYIPKRTTGASLYRPNEKVFNRFGDDQYWGEIEERDIQCMSLSDFLQKNSIKSPNLIKLDTQGSELDILRGINSKDFKSIFAIEVEVEFIEFYEKQPLFFDIHSYMEGMDFELIDLRTARSYYSKQNNKNYYIKKYLNTLGNSPLLGAHLVSGDALYFKKIDFEDFNKVDFFKKVIISAMYGYFDYALYIVDLAKERNLIAENEHQVTINFLIKKAPKMPIYTKNNLFGKLILKIGKRIGILNDNFISWMYRRWPDA